MHKVFFARFFAVTAFLLAFAAMQQVSAQQQPMLPERLGDITVNGHAFQPIPAGDSQILSETGFVAAEARMYNNRTQVDLYRFRDPSSAYEIFTHLNVELGSAIVGGGHPPEPPRSALMVIGGIDIEFFQVGNFVGRVIAKDKVSALAMERNIADELRKKADQAPLPPIRTYLPDGFAEGTLRYALGPEGFTAALESLHRGEYSRLAAEAGFKSGAEAMFAAYHKGKDEAGLLLLEYPTPQLAGLHLKHLEQALTPEAKAAGTTIERKASLLSIVLAPSSPEYAQKLRDAVNYETEVTWNEPTHKLTDPPLLSTIAKIILFTGLFMGVAFVLGVAFGGVRVLTKIFFPGKVFDRPEQLDVLQLGLSSKRINSRDFY